MRNRQQRITQLLIALEQISLWEKFSRDEYGIIRSTDVEKIYAVSEQILGYVLTEHGFTVEEGAVRKQNDWVSVVSFCAEEAPAFLPAQIREYARMLVLLKARVKKSLLLAETEWNNLLFLQNGLKSWFLREYKIVQKCTGHTRERLEFFLTESEREMTWIVERKDTGYDNQREKRFLSFYRNLKECQAELPEDSWMFHESGPAYGIPNPEQMKKILERQIIEEFRSVVREEMKDVIDEQTKLLVENQNSNTARLSKQLNHITEILEKMQERIAIGQEFTREQLRMAVSPEEKDRSLQAHMNICTEKFVQKIEESAEEEQYRQEEAKLRISLGESAWEKLTVDSRRFLVSAKVTYACYLGMQSVIDYSGVCLLVTKALEVELVKRFGTGYICFLEQHYPGEQQYKYYPSTMRNASGTPYQTNHFTLGMFPFILGTRFGNINEEQKQYDRLHLVGYSRQVLFPDFTEDEILQMLKNYGKKIDHITTVYRNRAAHTDALKRVDAEACFNLMIDVEKFLKILMDSFAS